ncbi:MAG: hypothetical protein V3V62_06915, partial [bacterium]
MNESELHDFVREAAASIARARDAAAAEEVRLRYLGRKGGLLTEVMRGLKDLPPDQKRAVGPLANQLKRLIEKGASAVKREGPSALGAVLEEHL